MSLSCMIFSGWTTQKGSKYCSKTLLSLDPNGLNNWRQAWIGNQIVDSDFPDLNDLVCVGTGLVSQLEKDEISTELNKSHSVEAKGMKSQSEKQQKLDISSSKHQLHLVVGNKGTDLGANGTGMGVSKNRQQVRVSVRKNVNKRKDDKWR